MSAFDIREAPPTAAASGYRCALVRWAGAPQGSSSAVRNGRRLLTVCTLGEEDPKRVRDPARWSRADHAPRLGGPRDLISQADYNTSVWRRQASPSRRNRQRASALRTGGTRRWRGPAGCPGTRPRWARLAPPYG